MFTVVFATTNEWKLQRAKETLEPFGIMVRSLAEVELLARELPDHGPTGSKQIGIEVQADTIEEVCSVKARTAADAVREPTIVEDIGVYIEALNGFPGPYIKYAVATIGVEGFLRLMNGVADRRTRLVSVVGYCEPGREPRLFSGEMPGEIADAMAARDDNPWANVLIYPIFRPHGEQRTLAQILPDELTASPSLPTRLSLTKFANWLTNHHGAELS